MLEQHILLVFVHAVQRGGEHQFAAMWPPERTCMNLAGLKMLTDWPGFEKLFREIGA